MGVGGCASVCGCGLVRWRFSIDSVMDVRGPRCSDLEATIVGLGSGGKSVFCLGGGVLVAVGGC